MLLYALYQSSSFSLNLRHEKKNMSERMGHSEGRMNVCVQEFLGNESPLVVQRVELPPISPVVVMMRPIL